MREGRGEEGEADEEGLFFCVGMCVGVLGLWGVGKGRVCVCAFVCITYKTSRAHTHTRTKTHPAHGESLAQEGVRPDIEELEGELRVDEEVGGGAPDGLHHEHGEQVEDEGPLPVAWDWFRWVRLWVV